jgi:hypothetical protein
LVLVGAAILLLPAFWRVSAGVIYDLADSASANAVLYGREAGDYFGSDLAVGDINGDNVGDVVVGAYLADGPGNSRNGSGEVYIYFGKSTSTWFHGKSPDVVVYGAESRDLLGGDDFREPGHIAMGDLDNDGTGDLIVSAPPSTWGASSTTGRVWIIWGQGVWPAEIDLASRPANLQITVVYAAGRDFLGSALATGDLDGDGMDDLAMSAPLEDGSSLSQFGAGAVYVLFGGNNLRSRDIHLGNVPQDMSVFKAIGPVALAKLGRFLAFGKLSNDGTDDLVIGSEKVNNDTGTVHVLFGGNVRGITWNLAFRAADWTVVGEANFDQFGHSLAAGDITGDGQADLIAGAPSADGPNASGAGQIVGFFGPLPKGEQRFLSTNPADLTIYGPESSPDDQSWLGEVAAGDVNSDQVVDVIAGARQANGFGNRSESGVVYVFHGGPALRGMRNLRSDSADLTLVGANPRDFMGYVAAGDVTNDGIDDIVISATGDWPEAGTQTGVVYVRFGAGSGGNQNPAPTRTPTIRPSVTPAPPTQTPTVTPTPKPQFTQFLPLLTRNYVGKR